MVHATDHENIVSTVPMLSALLSPPPRERGEAGRSQHPLPSMLFHHIPDPEEKCLLWLLVSILSLKSRKSSPKESDDVLGGQRSPSSTEIRECAHTTMGLCTPATLRQPHMDCCTQQVPGRRLRPRLMPTTQSPDPW